jgi:hypothetical protein
LSLIYDSSTLPQPIVVLETFLQDSSDVPDEIAAQLTFNSTAGTAYTYDTTSLSAGDNLRFALQADATSLATGHYDYSVKLTADMDSTLVDHIYVGVTDIVNRGASTYPFGRGWQLAGLDQLVIGSGGVSWVQDDGDSLWFAEDGGGGFEPAAGSNNGTGPILFGTKVASRYFLDFGLASDGQSCHLGEHDDCKAENQGTRYHRVEVFRAAGAAARTLAR